MHATVRKATVHDAVVIRDVHIASIEGLAGTAYNDDVVTAWAHDCESRQTLPFFRAVNIDVETFGNHDFDYGTEPILDVVAASPEEWIVGNLHEGESGADSGNLFAGLDRPL